MDRFTRWLARLGNAGAIANARSVLEQRASEVAAVERLAGRLPSVTERPAAAA